MTAYRVVDDHFELDNVGSNTHDQIDTHVDTTPFLIVSGTVGNIPANARLLSGSGIVITDNGPGGTLVLTTTGGGGVGTPGGNDTEVQFNDGGLFGGDSSFTFNKNTNTLSVTNISGSLTKLVDGTSYLIAGSNIVIVTGSNGSITISSTASGSGGGGGGSGDPDATYLVLSTTGSLNNERAFVVGNGLNSTDSGSGGNYTVSINDSQVATISGSTFSGTVKFNSGLSGSLTKLIDGSSYLIAGSNLTITTGSNGAVTISAPPTIVQLQQMSWMEVPNGDIDGINMVYTLANTPSPSNSLMFYVNGVLQLQGLSNDYDLTGNSVIMNYSPSSGSSVIATYGYVLTPSVGSYTSWMEVPMGFVDGTNNIFTLSNNPQPSSALMFYVNGILQRQGITFDYTISSNTITMNYTPNSGSVLITTYPY